VIQRARTLLRELENSSNSVQSRTTEDGQNQMDLFSPPHQVADTIQEMNLENLTPIDALQKLKDFQDRLDDSEDDES